VKKRYSLAAGLVAVIMGAGLWFGLNAGHGEAARAAVPAGTTIPYNGSNWNLHGVNMAWYNWACDFGCGANGGVSSTKSTLAPRFSQLASSNVRNVRWWMFEGDAWQVERDSSGNPTRINPTVYQDLDAALELARQYDLYLTLVVFNFPGDIPPSWLSNPAQRQKVADVLAPMFARYANESHILAWEVFNEPEWDMWSGKVNTAQTQDFVRTMVNTVHANSSRYATVGSAMLDGLQFWTGMGLDFYQAHWYDYMRNGNWDVTQNDYATVKARYGLDKPLVIGEFYAGTDANALSRYQMFFDKGYAGAWAWSLWPERNQDGLAIDMNGTAQFARNNASIVGPQSGGSPTAPVPTATTAPRTPTTPPSTPSTVPTTAPRVPTTPVATATATTPRTTSTVTTPAAPAITAWATSATVSTGTVNRGAGLTVTAKATAPTTSRYLIDVELYTPSGVKWHQKWWDNTAMTAGQAKDFTLTWTIPANAERGTWTVKVAGFTAGWGQVVHWNGAATTFTVR